MKKILFCTSLLLLFLTSCSKNGEMDELLNGTKWAHSNLEMQGGNENPDVTTSNILSQLESMFQVEYSSSESKDDVSSKTQWFSMKETATLKFNGTKCSLIVTSEKSGETTTTTKKMNLLTFVAKTYTSNSYGTLAVTSDGIYLKRSDEPETKVMQLDNFTTEYPAGESSVEKTAASQREEELNVVLTYSRANNQVVMSNKEYKFLGNLNLEDETMTVSQVLPTAEENRFEFELETNK